MYNEVEFYSNVKTFSNLIKDRTSADDDIMLSKSELDNLGNLLGNFFENPIQYVYMFSSEDIWREFDTILDGLCRTANDFVSQREIDDFFMKLIEMKELHMFKIISASDNITVSESVKAAYKDTIYKFGLTVEKVKKIIPYHLKGDDFDDNHFSGTKVSQFCLKHTPLGVAKVKILKNTQETKVFLFLTGKNNSKTVPYDITSSCMYYLTEYGLN